MQPRGYAPEVAEEFRQELETAIRLTQDVATGAERIGWVKGYLWAKGFELDVSDLVAARVTVEEAVPG